MTSENDSIDDARRAFPELGDFFEGLHEMREACLIACGAVRLLAPSRQDEFRLGARGIALALRRCADDIERASANLELTTDAS